VGRAFWQEQHVGYLAPKILLVHSPQGARAVMQQRPVEGAGLSNIQHGQAAL
jgi:hypothetical protein